MLYDRERDSIRLLNSKKGLPINWSVFNIKEDDVQSELSLSEFNDLTVEETVDDTSEWKTGGCRKVSNSECTNDMYKTSTSSNSDNNNFDMCLTESMYQLILKNSLYQHHQIKHRKTEHLVPIVFANFRMNLGAPKIQKLKYLINTGSSGTILFKDHGFNLWHP